MPDPIFPDVPRDRPSIEFFACPPALEGVVSGFNVYGTFGLPPGSRESYFPGWATVRFNYGEGPVRARYSNGRMVEVPPAALFGPGSSQFDFELGGETISIGFGITPLGLWRMFGRPANGFTDRTLDLAALWPDALSIHEALAREPDSGRAAVRLAAVVADRLGPPLPDVALVRELMQALVSDHQVNVSQLSDQLGRSVRVLQRIALKHFGFPLKLLLRRSRFLKTLHAIYGTPPGEWSHRLDAGYHDQSQFIRDCHDFLGMSPGAFLRQSRPLYDLSVRKRTAAIGAPYMALQAPQGEG